MTPADEHRNCPKCGELSPRFCRLSPNWMGMIRGTPECEEAMASRDRVSGFYCGGCRSVLISAFSGDALVSDDGFLMDSEMRLNLPGQLVPPSLAYTPEDVAKHVRWSHGLICEQQRRRTLLGRPVVKPDDPLVDFWLMNESLAENADFIDDLHERITQACKGVLLSRQVDGEDQRACWLRYSLGDFLRMEVQMARLERKWGNVMRGRYAVCCLNEGERYLAQNRQGLTMAEALR